MCMQRGERMPGPDESGLTMSLYLPSEELEELDRLRAHWGLSRNGAVRRAISDQAAASLTLK